MDSASSPLTSPTIYNKFRVDRILYTPRKRQPSSNCALLDVYSTLLVQ